MTGHDVVDLARKFEDYGVEGIIYTDIGRDGMLSGVNIDATVKLAREIKVPVIASGGLSTIADIERLVLHEADGIIGAIAGRAIYEGTLNFKEALKAAKFAPVSVEQSDATLRFLFADTDTQAKAIDVIKVLGEYLPD